MTTTSILARIAIAVSIAFGAVAAGAQPETIAVPAELPPAGYDGGAFVDSRGCAFVRAAIGGDVAWVPRVTRSGRQICEEQPTFADVQQAPDPAGATGAPAAEATQASVGPARGAGPAAPARLVRPAPRIAPEASAEPGGEGAPAARRAPAPRRVQVALIETFEGPHGGADPPPVAMAPRDGSPGPRTVRGPAVRALPLETRVVPLHVYKDRSTRGERVPDGYVPAWKDGRLNPERAVQSLRGYYATQRIWTNTVPRRAREGRPRRVRDPVVIYRR